MNILDEKYRLPNGLVVLLKSCNRLPLVSVQFWVKVGSIFENDKNNGISHFLEHLVFKGTNKYSVKQISKIIERYGAILNAATSKEFTVYYVDIPKEGLEDAIDVLSQLVFEATFPEEELEKERKVIIEEIKRADDNPFNLLYDGFNNLLFRETPYKQRVLGKKENIENLTKQEILDYYKTFYQPKNIVVSICGDINIEETKKLISKNLSKYDNSLVPPIKFELLESHKDDILKVERHNVEHAYFLCGFLGPAINDKHLYTAEVLSVMVGEGISSRLNKILREEKMLVYEINSGFYPQLGNSVFYIFGVCDRKNLENSIKEIKNVLNKIKKEGPLELELNKAKQIITTRYYFDNETVHSKASSFAWWEIFRSLDEYKSYLENIHKVSVQDIKEFLEIYYRGNLVCFSLVPN